MIYINNKEVKLNAIKVQYDKFTCSYIQDGKNQKRNGISPYILFKIDNDITIGIETTCPVNYFQNWAIGTKLDFSQYISDIIYTSNEDWMPIIDENLECYIEKVNNNLFKLKLKLECETENITIEINQDVDIDYEYI